MLAGDAFRIAGALAPAAAGERVVLRMMRNGRRVRTRRVAVRPRRPLPRASSARPGRGALRIRASTAPGGPCWAPPRPRRCASTVVAPRAAPGDARPARAAACSAALARLRYAVSRSGVFDAATARAVMAYRKVNWTTAPLRRRPRRRAARAGRPGRLQCRATRAPGATSEADTRRQVLALVDRGSVVAHLPRPRRARRPTPTVIGSFRVYLKTPGVNVLGMVHSSYFIRGYAIHGYVDVPAFNASHGCLRVPLADARRIYDWLHLGDRVIVYP